MKYKHNIKYSLLLLSLSLAGCGGGGGGGDHVPPPNPGAGNNQVLTLSPITFINEGPNKGMAKFEWSGSPTPINYTLCMKNSDPLNSCTVIGNVEKTTTLEMKLVSLFEAYNKSFYVTSELEGKAIVSNEMSLSSDVVTQLIPLIETLDPLADNGQFGSSITLSDNGKKLAVLLPNKNTVDIYTRNEGQGESWRFEEQLAFPILNIGVTEPLSVSFSQDGRLIAIGSPHEGLEQNGSVYLYQETDGVWTKISEILNQQDPLTPKAYFGSAVSLSADGNKIAVSAIGVRSNTIFHSFLYVFNKIGDVWQNSGSTLSPTGAIGSSRFGKVIALSADGNTLVASDPGEDQRKGVAYIFTQNTTDLGWSHQERITASNGDIEDKFGESISINADGTQLAIGAPSESSNSQAMPYNKGALKSGAAYIFNKNQTWQQAQYIKAKNIGAADEFGTTLMLRGDTLVIGSPYESSNYVGVTDINQIQENNDTPSSGAVYVYKNINATWQPTALIKAKTQLEDNFFGSGVAFSGQTKNIMVGATRATGSSDIPASISVY